MPEDKIEVVLITGKINSGKTASIINLVEKERAKGNSPTGVIAHGVFENGIKIGFDVEDIASGEKIPLARVSEVFDISFSVGRFTFSAKGFDFACKALLRFKPGGVVFIDEAGPLELKGGGYAECLHALLKSGIAKIYIVVRDDCVKEFIEKFLQGENIEITERNK